jgi:hypothetical protein
MPTTTTADKRGDPTKFEEFSVDLSQVDAAGSADPGGAAQSRLHLNQSVRDPNRFWTKEGAMVMLRAEHEPEVDPNLLAEHLKVSVLDLVLSNPPCAPIFASAGLMLISNPAFRSKSLKPPEPGLASTMIPLLVTALYPEAALDWPDVLFDYLEEATEECRLRPYAPWLTAVERVVVPLPQRQVRILERRGIGTPACGARKSVQ